MALNTRKLVLSHCSRCSVLTFGSPRRPGAMSRQKLTEGDAQPDRNGGQDTAEHDLVIYRDMVLVNLPQHRKCDPPAVNVLHLLHPASSPR